MRHTYSPICPINFTITFRKLQTFGISYQPNATFLKEELVLMDKMRSSQANSLNSPQGPHHPQEQSHALPVMEPYLFLMWIHYLPIVLYTLYTYHTKGTSQTSFPNQPSYPRTQ